MKTCFFVTDLHGEIPKYEKLFRLVEAERPAALFMGGDILPGHVRLLSGDPVHMDFVNGFLYRRFSALKAGMGAEYPRVFMILGNDDGRFQEAAVLDAGARGAWEYAHGRKLAFGDLWVYGYSYVPPTPFQLKDWERYDVSRFVDPGCVHPEEGMLSVPVADYELRFATIHDDLTTLVGGDDVSKAIFLFHSPPYRTCLDRAALDGKSVDFVPLDVHVGSIAIRRFIAKRSPLITLHGHIHESTRLTGRWLESCGPTVMMGAAHDGPELALVRFDPEKPLEARRELV